MSKETPENDEKNLGDEQEAAIILANIAEQQSPDGDVEKGDDLIVFDSNLSVMPLTTNEKTPTTQSLEHSYSAEETKVSAADDLDCKAKTPNNTETLEHKVIQGSATDEDKQSEKVLENVAPLGYTVYRQAYLAKSCKWIFTETVLEEPKSETNQQPETIITSTESTTPEPEPPDEKQGSQDDKSAPPSLDDFKVIVSATASNTGMSLSARFGVEQQADETTISQTPEAEPQGKKQLQSESITKPEEDKDSFSSASEGSSTKGKRRSKRKPPKVQPTQAVNVTRSSKHKKS